MFVCLFRWGFFVVLVFCLFVFVVFCFVLFFFFLGGGVVVFLFKGVRWFMSCLCIRLTEDDDNGNDDGCDVLLLLFFVGC